MIEFERELRALGRDVEYPPMPNLARSVAARIERRRPPQLRRRVALALVVLLLAIGIAFAVPPARTEILRFLGLNGVTIEFVDKVPSSTIVTQLRLGDRTTLAAAQAAVRYRILTSPLLGAPDEVYLNADAVGFVYRHRAGGVKLLVTQFPGFERPDFAKKLLTKGTRAEGVEVKGEPGYFISGKPHFFLYLDPEYRVVQRELYLAGNTLLWQHGTLTLRLEGKLTRDQALAIARSFVVEKGS
jgi:hypothetical protein